MTTEKKRFRREEISVRFHDGFVAEWKMAVGEYFKNALDIKKTPRKKEGRQRLVETEGVPQCYAFDVGDTIYSSKKAYRNPWSDAVPHIDLAVTILEASPDRPIGRDGKEEGYVRVQFLRPSEDRSRLELGEVKYLSQEDFVFLLKAGRLPTKKNPKQ